MKKHVAILLFFLLLPAFAFGQQVIDNFEVQPDSGVWIEDVVFSSTTSGIEILVTDEQVQNGSKSARLDWAAQATEGWGGYANIMRWAPGATLFDLSLGTHISLWYYNAEPSSIPGAVEFRILLKDVSEVGDTLSSEAVETAEFWYSHARILDAEPGWNQILMPLEDVMNNTDQGGFWLPGWAGAGGNGKLDLQKIKGIKFEFSIDASPHNPTNPSESGLATGQIFLDNFRVVGHRNPVINFFDTTEVALNAVYFGTGSSDITITDNVADAFEEASAQLDWTVDADQSWGGFASVLFESDDFLPDMSTFSHLSLRFNNKVASDQPGNVVLRLQIHEYSEGADQEEVWIYETNAVLESEAGWQQLLIPLNDRGAGVPPNAEGFSNPGWSGVPGNSTLDWDKIRSYEFAFSGAQQGTVSKGTLLLDNLELYGFRETDFTAPNAPQGVSAVPDRDNYFNLVIWQDVPGETNETYTVYASRNPITSLTASGVLVVESRIPRGRQTAVHRLTYPLNDTEIGYYYAVTATDAAGNISEAGGGSTIINNLARGIATVSLQPPTNFVPDGNISEWESAGIKPFVLKPSTSKVAAGSFANDDDLTATIYMAVDNEYLYLAADVIDDNFSFDPEGNWWEDDAIELFIGFYDLRTAPHQGFQRGAQPDYQLSFRNNVLVNGRNGDQVIYTPDSTNYHFEDFGSDWVVETRIRLTDIAFGDDVLLNPRNGMRIPFDILVHDADATNVRDGVVAFSERNNDNSWQSPSNWAHTWIGDQFDVTTSVDDTDPNVPLAYSLSQNYPNPFNPTTSIRYALKQAGAVKIELYNTLGQKVRTLVDEVKPAGTYTLQVDAASLASGVYFYRIQTSEFQQTRKMVLMR